MPCGPAARAHRGGEFRTCGRFAALQKLTIAGHIDKFSADKDVVLEGWGRLSSGDGNGGMIRLDTDLPIARVEVEAMARPDVVGTVGDPGLAFSGFRIRLVLEPAGVPRAIRSASARTTRYTDSSACTTTRRCPARCSADCPEQGARDKIVTEKLFEIKQRRSVTETMISN